MMLAVDNLQRAFPSFTSTALQGLFNAFTYVQANIPYKTN